MATKSLHDDMILDTQEAVDNFIRAFELAKHRAPRDLSETRGISSNSELLDELMRNIP